MRHRSKVQCASSTRPFTALCHGRAVHRPKTREANFSLLHHDVDAWHPLGGNILHRSYTMDSGFFWSFSMELAKLMIPLVPHFARTPSVALALALGFQHPLLYKSTSGEAGGDGLIPGGNDQLKTHSANAKSQCAAPYESWNTQREVNAYLIYLQNTQ